MSLFGGSLWEGCLPGGNGQSAWLGSIDTRVVLDGLLPTLHADNFADLTFWSKADLIEWCDEGLKRLARLAAWNVEQNSSITTKNGVASYPLPERQDATLYVSLGNPGVTPLRPAAMIELEARDSTFMTDTGTPDHWYEDGQGDNVGLTPVPTTAGAVTLVMSAWPVALDAAQVNTLVQAPAAFAGYLTFYVLGQCYSKEGPVEMSDVAAHCASRCQMYEALFIHYFGKGI
jgi:hypothetical protein